MDPFNRHGVDETKVSHHILRVGYHIRSEVLAEACNELGYIYDEDSKKFMKEADFRTQSILERTMISHGLKPVPGAGLLSEEKKIEQVRAAVKELFPKIPDEDLEYIIQHAWAEGSNRVGTIDKLSLPRRVQLATIARIRHHYTDYDRLLRAFEWGQARQMVEPTCVQKLLEWRGESEQEGDDELEEIVREVIVIDDEDDDQAIPAEGSHSDESGSDLAMHDREASVKITYHRAADDDLGAESHDERSMQFLNRYNNRAARYYTQRDQDLRDRIGQVRRQMRNPARSDAPAGHNVVQVVVPDEQLGFDKVTVDGRVFKRAQVAPVTPRPLLEHNSIGNRHSGAETNFINRDNQLSIPTYSATHDRQNQSPGVALHDRPIASIEGQDDPRRNEDHIYLGDHASQSAGEPVVYRRLDEDRRHLIDPSHYGRADDGHHYRAIDSAVENMTLSTGSPHRRQDHTVFVSQQPPSSRRHEGYVTMPTQSASHAVALHVPTQGYHYPLSAATTAPTHHGLVDAQIAPIQYVPLRPTYRTHEATSRHGAQPGIPQRVVYARHPQAQYQPQPMQHIPQPVHGAPAAVQQMSRSVRHPEHLIPLTQVQHANIQPTHYYPR